MSYFNPVVNCRNARRFLLSIVLIVAIVHGHPNGAPSDACDDMTPGHDIDPQSSAVPFAITTDKKNYKNEDTVTITIKPIDSSSGEQFKGFLVAARKVSQSNLNKFNSTVNVGEFQTMAVNGTRTSKLVNCNRPGDAITHKNNDAKDTIKFKWIPDEGLTGEVIFIGTIVKDYDNFWIGIKSSSIKIS